MKVFSVYSEDRYYNRYIEAVFTTKNKALEYIVKKEKLDSSSYYDYDEVELDPQV
jgi:hypothetical protein